MNDIPAGFRAKIAEHNRHAALAAVLSLFGACLSWLLAYGFFAAVMIIGVTVAEGIDARSPRWLNFVAGGICLILLVWASVDHWFNRYRPLQDRPVLGLHNIADILLLPARMTFAVWEHWGARIRLSPGEVEASWQLLQVIGSRDKVPLHELGGEIPYAPDLDKLLAALQLSSWIDLHRSDDGWFYKLRSDRVDDYRALTA